MAHWVTSRSRPHIGPHPPAKKETLDALRKYVSQARRHLQLGGPAADIELLFHGEPTHFTSLEVVAIGDHPAVAVKFNSRKLDFGLRHLRPEALALLRGLTLYGGGLAINKNHNRTGHRSYIRYGRPYVQVVRFLLDIEAGREARQTGANFREVVSGGSFEDARGTRRPRKGREHAVAFALKCHRRTHRKTDLELSAADYDALLWELFALLDAADEARSKPTAGA